MRARILHPDFHANAVWFITRGCSFRGAALVICLLWAWGAGEVRVQAADEAEEESADRATYTRLIWEEGVESRPIQGATVVLRHVVGGPGTEKVVETTTHKTNEHGEYSFSVSKKHAADPTFSIAVNLSHPRYDACLPHLDGGLFPLKLYEDEVHTGPRRVLEMRPCDEVTGIIQDVNRKAVADAEVTGYSYRDGPDSYREVKTDRQGRFRFNILRGGHVFVVARYKGYAATVHRVGKKSGEVGPLMLEAGKVVTGVVLKSDGTPLEDAWVVAKTGGELSLHDPIVPPLIDCSAKTDAKGRFEIPLTNGLYTIGVYPLAKPWEMYPREKPWSVPPPQPLPAVFHPTIRRLTVTKTKPTSLEFRRAAPRC